MRLTERELRRGGFSLIELLVVISIIGVLMALIVPAIFNFLSRGPQIATFNEIGQLEMAVANFQRDYNVKFIPSRIVLGEKLTDYNAAEQGSITYLATLWPHITDPKGAWANAYIDWNGNGLYDSGSVTLEGDQALVFFLGGIPLGAPPPFPLTNPHPPSLAKRVADGSPAGGGFSANQRNPSHPSGRKRPYYEFKGDKLKFRPSAIMCPPAAGYYSYYDPHSTGDLSLDKPFAFFSSNGGRNKYNPVGDCPTINVTSPPNPLLLPPTSYAEGAGRFHNPDGFQIVSAGADRIFGWAPNGIWTPAIADQVSASCSFINDDQSNFYGSLMGVGR